jgi:hypothetical protein
MNSPELLRYVLIASLPLMLISIGLGWRFGNSRIAVLFAEIVWWSFIMWVPLEAISYICGSWSLHGRDLFSVDYLPLLMIVLTVWSLILAILAALFVVLIRNKSIFSNSQAGK